MSEQVFVLCSEYGQYSDHCMTVLGVYRDEELAQAAVNQFEIDLKTYRADLKKNRAVLEKWNLSDCYPQVYYYEMPADRQFWL